jgi:hypothetical protein
VQTLTTLGSTTNDVLRQWLKNKQFFQDANFLENGEVVFEQPTKIQLRQKNMGSTLEITVSKFLPSPGDATFYPWKDASGEDHILEMPPYYISDMAEAKRNIIQYARKTSGCYMKSLLSEANPIIRDTFSQACSFIISHKVSFRSSVMLLGLIIVNQSELLKTALQFWSATRLTEIVWTICDGNDIGLTPPADPENPWCDILPVTPVMDTQLDELAIGEVLIPLRDKLLKLLDDKVREEKKENFFEIYLATFIIMSNFEFIFSDVIDYTTRHGMTVS